MSSTIKHPATSLDPDDVLYVVREYTQATYRLYERLSSRQKDSVRRHLEDEDGSVGGLLRDIHGACGDVMVQGLMRTSKRPQVADTKMATRRAVHLRALVACAPYQACDSGSAEICLRGGPLMFRDLLTNDGWTLLFRALHDDAACRLADAFQEAR